MEHPNISNCAVLGVADDALGEAIAAVISCDGKKVLLQWTLHCLEPDCQIEQATIFPVFGKGAVFITAFVSFFPAKTALTIPFAAVVLSILILVF